MSPVLRLKSVCRDWKVKGDISWSVGDTVQSCDYASCDHTAWDYASCDHTAWDCNSSSQ